MEAIEGLPAWVAPGWADETSAWIDDALAGVSVERVGPVSPHKVRPWSVVMTVPTRVGTVWFKENCPEQRHEAAVLALLDRVVPGHVLDQLMVDGSTGRMLSPDRGPTLRSVTGDDDVEMWVRLVREYAELARDLVPHAAALAEAGVPRLGEPGSYLEGRVAAFERPNQGLDPGEVARLRAMVPVARGWRADLDASGLPETLDHNDLHTNNAFAAPPGTPHRFFDFGDAVLAHPLCVMLVPLNVMANTLETGFDDPRLTRVVDAVVEVWSDRVPTQELRSAVPAALGMARLHRSESWRRALASGGDAGDFEGADRDWLLTLIDAG